MYRGESDSSAVYALQEIYYFSVFLPFDVICCVCRFIIKWKIKQNWWYEEKNSPYHIIRMRQPGREIYNYIYIYIYIIICSMFRLINIQYNHVIIVILLLHLELVGCFIFLSLKEFIVGAHWRRALTPTSIQEPGFCGSKRCFIVLWKLILLFWKLVWLQFVYTLSN